MVHKIASPGKVLWHFIPVTLWGMNTFMVRNEIALDEFPRDFIKVTLNSPFVTYRWTVLVFLTDSLNTVSTRRSPKSIEYSIVLAVPFSCVTFADGDWAMLGGSKMKSFWYSSANTSIKELVLYTWKILNWEPAQEMLLTFEAKVLFKQWHAVLLNTVASGNFFFPHAWAHSYGEVALKTGW